MSLKIDRNQHSSGLYVDYRISQNDTTYPLYEWTTSSYYQRTYHSSYLNPKWANYRGIAYGDYGWALWGTYVPVNTDYDIEGTSTTVPIITNGHTGATLNFTSAGFLDVTPSDTVNVKAVSGTVTVRNDARSSIYGGTVNAVSGGVDIFDVNGTNLHLNSGNGNDSIIVSNTGNYYQCW